MSFDFSKFMQLGQPQQENTPAYDALKESMGETGGDLADMFATKSDKQDMQDMEDIGELLGIV